MLQIFNSYGVVVKEINPGIKISIINNQDNMIKLAIPKNKIYDELLIDSEKIGSTDGIEIIRANENECSRLMLNNMVSAALLTPIGYGSGMYQADYRIIPASVLVSEAYTSLASIFFKKDMRFVKKFTTNAPDDFIIIIGRLLLAEKYNLFPESEHRDLSETEIINTSETSIVWGGSKAGDTALDISEEWHDIHDLPLPLAFWVCRAEEHPENLIQIIESISAKNSEKIISEQNGPGKKHFQRQGRLIMKWNEDIAHALELTMHFLYYHRIFADIPAVKVLGRDEEHK